MMARLCLSALRKTRAVPVAGAVLCCLSVPVCAVCAAEGRVFL